MSLSNALTGKHTYTVTNMPKNTKGGKKGKRGGNKHSNPSAHRAVRTVQEQGECYAAVTRLYGGSNCEVICDDGVTRLCVIRNKFRGRGKRDNTLVAGKLVMVGIRDWEARAAGKQEKCDLLEVYSDNDKKRLISDYPGNWHILCSAEENAAREEDENGAVFFDDTEDNEEMEQELQEEAKMSTGKEAVLDQLGDFIDIDDI